MAIFGDSVSTVSRRGRADGAAIRRSLPRPLVHVAFHPEYLRNHFLCWINSNPPPISRVPRISLSLRSYTEDRHCRQRPDRSRNRKKDRISSRDVVGSLWIPVSGGKRP